MYISIYLQPAADFTMIAYFRFSKMCPCKTHYWCTQSVLNSVTYSTCQLPFDPGLDCELQTVRKKTIISRINRKYPLDYHLCTLPALHSSSTVTPSELGNNKSTLKEKISEKDCPSFFLVRFLKQSSCLSDDVSWSRQNNPYINFTSFYSLIELL